MNIYKTMYHAPKPEGIERRKAYIVGGGIAGCVIRAMPITDSGTWRSPIPGHADHRPSGSSRTDLERTALDNFSKVGQAHLPF